MPAINFPNSPTNGQVHTVNNRQWAWNGSKWLLDTNPIASQVTPGLVSVGSGLAVTPAGELSLDLETSFFETVVPVASNGQTAFVVDGGYISASVTVLVNGVELLRTRDYTATDGINLTLTTGINTTDTLLVRTWRAYLNAGPVSIPGTPVNTSPENASTVSLAKPTFVGGAFIAPDGATHAASQLQISTVSTFATTVYDSGSLSPLTSIQPPGGLLATSTTYHWRMRYQSSGGQWSAWSIPTSFSTAATLESYIDTPAATPAAFGAPFEGGYYAGLIWNEVTRSATSTTIGTGSKTFTVADNQNTTPQFYAGQQVEVRSRGAPTSKMFGSVTFASGTTLTVNVTTTSGSGTGTDWSVMAQYRVIVAPKASGEAASLTYKNVATAGPAAANTPSEGLKATAALVQAGTPGEYPAAWFCHDLTIGGLTDWYLPSMCELELAYRNLKPHTTNNHTSQRFGSGVNLGSNLYGDITEPGGSTSGANSNSGPVGAAYTTTVPGQVAAGVNFRTGESEAFEATVYLALGDVSSGPNSVTTTNFATGAQSIQTKTTASRVRAVRRSII